MCFNSPVRDILGKICNIMNKNSGRFRYVSGTLHGNKPWQPRLSEILWKFFISFLHILHVTIKWKLFLGYQKKKPVVAVVESPSLMYDPNCQKKNSLTNFFQALLKKTHHTTSYLQQSRCIQWFPVCCTFLKPLSSNKYWKQISID